MQRWSLLQLSGAVDLRRVRGGGVVTRLRLDQALEGEIRPRDMADLRDVRLEAVRGVWNNVGDHLAAMRRIDGAVALLAKQLKENA